MALNDPVLGLSGALTSLQGGVPPMSAATNFSQSQDGGGASDLSRAARSLESVQGDFSGQTMAIRQMSQNVQQQSMSTQMLMSQLGTQISALTQVMRDVAGSAGRGAMVGGGLAMQGLSAFGGMAGSAGAFAASPFLGGQAFRPPGSFGPQFGGDVGFMRAAGMASGIGIQPENIRLAHAGQIQQAAAERAGLRAGDAFMGMLGGGANLGGALGGEMLGSGIGSALGAKAGLSGMALGGAGLAGSVVGGMGIGAVVGAGVNETMGQVANIRGFGSQFARNAAQFMDVGDARRQPGFRQRQQFGQAMNRMSIQDLTFDEGDMQEIFASMSQNDLLRGTRNTRDVINRIREGKEAIKAISRNMGVGISEAAGMMGELQSAGIDPTSARGRSAIFGASTVMGMAPSQAAGAAGGFAQQYTAQGLGSGANALALRSLNMGKFAVGPGGSLTAQQTAALGGSGESAGLAAANMEMQFLQSGLGRATLLAGSTGGGTGFNASAVMGKGPRGIMGAAGARANQDVNAMARLSMGGDEMMRAALEDPLTKVSMFRSIKGIADQIKQPGMDDSVAFQLAMKTQFPNMTQTQIKGMMNMFRDLPEATRARQRQAGRTASLESTNIATEQTSMVSQVQRLTKEQFSPVSEGISRAGADIETGVSRTLTGAYKRFTGLRTTSLSGGIDVGELGNALAEDRVDEDVPTDLGHRILGGFSAVSRRNAARRAQTKLRDVSVSKETQTRVNDVVAKNFVNRKGKIDRLANKIKDPSTLSGDRMSAAREVMNQATNGAYDKASPAERKAMQLSVAQRTGVDIGAMLAGGGSIDMGSEQDMDKAEGLRRDIAAATGMGDPGKVSELARPEVLDYLKAIESGSGIDDAREKAVKALGPGGEALLAGVESDDTGFFGSLARSASDMATLGYATTGEFGMEGVKRAGMGYLNLLVPGASSALFGDEENSNRRQDVIRALGGKDGKGGLVDLQKSLGTRGQVGVIGSGVRKALTSIKGGTSRFQGLTSMFSGGTAGTVKGLSALIGDRDMLGEEQLSALGKGDDASQRLAEVVRSLRGISGEIGDTRNEQEIVRQLFGGDEAAAKEAIAEANKHGEIGIIATKALEIGKNVGNVDFSRGGVGETAALNILQQNARNQKRIADELNKLTAQLKSME